LDFGDKEKVSIDINSSHEKKNLFMLVSFIRGEEFNLDIFFYKPCLRW